MDYAEMEKIIREFDSYTYKCMGKVIFGHEVWLDNIQCCFESNKFSADLLYGHNMCPDGKAPQRYVNVLVLDCEGSSIDVSIEEIEEGHRISFTGNGKAPYTMYNETVPMIWNLFHDGTWKAGVKRDFANVKNSATYQMYAKAVFSEAAPSELEQTILEIIPDSYKLTPGRKASFKVLYEGKPLAGKEMKFFCKQSREEIFSVTDEEGNVSLDVNSPGDWMILMRFRDESKAVEDEFDETVFIMTLVMKAE